MSEQLQLVEVPEEPRLTERQQAIYDAIANAAQEGLAHDELGALEHARRGRHTVDERCQWCGRDGKAVGAELRAKGLVAWRRKRKAWTVAGKLPVRETPAERPQDGVWQGDGPIPYGTIPFQPVPCRARLRAAVRRAAA